MLSAAAASAVDPNGWGPLPLRPDRLGVAADMVTGFAAAQLDASRNGEITLLHVLKGLQTV
jgi:hypothetical protein